MLIDVAEELVRRKQRGWEIVGERQQGDNVVLGPALVHPYTGHVAWATLQCPPAPAGRWWVGHKLAALSKVPLSPNAEVETGALQERGACRQRALVFDQVLELHPELSGEEIGQVVEVVGEDVSTQAIEMAVQGLS